MTKTALTENCPGLVVEHTVIQTVGDKRPDLKLSEFSQGDRPVVDKGIFTKELETALMAREIDAAVHSLKDVPTELGEGFEIMAVLPRAPVEDILISKHAGGFSGLPQGAVVATSSVRRQALLRWLRPDLVAEDIRGNVPTRIKKLAASERWDAIILARAGLVRLGYHIADGGALDIGGRRLTVAILDPQKFLPAASQGAVAIEVWEPGGRVAGAFAAINHGETFDRIRAERHFLHLLEAGCQTPVGVLTSVERGRLSMKVAVFEEGGPAVPKEVSAVGAAADPEAVASEVFGLLD